MPSPRPEVPRACKWRRNGFVNSTKNILMKIRVAGINFDHFHMGDFLRMVFDHPDAEIAGIFDEDPRRMEMSIRNFKIPPDRVFSGVDECIEKSRPDFVILCPATSKHADYVERV